VAKYIDEESSGKVLELVNSSSGVDLINKIKDFTSKFEGASNNVPESNVSFERLADIKIDDEQIKNQAEEELLSYKKENYDKILNQTIEKEAELKENKESLQENYNSAVENIAKSYDEVRKKASNDALNRGLQRSSIVINKLDAFNQDEINTYNTLNKELTASLNAIDFELNSLEAQQELALDEFDITYAVKLNEKIASLKQELLDKQTEITKYNNQIAEKEANFDLKYQELVNTMNKENWNQNMDMLDMSAEYGSNVLEKYKQNQIYNIVDNYLAGLSKAEAKALLESNDTVKSYLTSQNLNSLLSKYS